jgi:Fic family protein
MFSPEFQITNKILSSLIRVEVDKSLVEIATLQDEWESRLRLESLVKRVDSLFHFLGNSLGVDDMAKIVRDDPGRDDKASEVALRVGVVGKEKDIQQVLNFLNANKLVEQIAYLTNKFKQTEYGESDLIKLNSLMGERLVAMPVKGVYRQTDISDNDQVVAPLAVEVSFQMEDLFGWFKRADQNEIHPVLKAGTMLFELLRITPFASHNLETAFSFCLMTLASEGYHFKKLWSPEEEILKNEDVYGTTVASVSRNKGDLTVWLERYVRWLDESAEKTRSKVLNLVGGMPVLKSEKGRVISLTERQIAIMEEITVRNELSIKEIRSVLPMVSDDTILRDLKNLIEKKLIKKKGKTKGALYVMGKVKSYR